MLETVYVRKTMAAMNVCLFFLKLITILLMFFLFSAYPWHHYSDSYCWNGKHNGTLDPDGSWSYWHHLLYEKPHYLQNLFREKDVKKASILKRRGIKASHEACTAKPIQGYFGDTYLLPHLLLVWNQCNVDVYLVKWRDCRVLQSAIPNHMACSLRACLCCHRYINLNVSTVPTQSSCLISGADGEAASSFAPLLQNVDEMIKEKPDLSDGQVTSQSQQALTYCRSHLSWVRGHSSPLNSSDTAVRYTMFYFLCGVVLPAFLSLS